MDLLTSIGVLLLLFGLIIFSLKLIAYNREKYQTEETQATPSDFSSPFTNNISRLLALIILIFAIIILYIFNK